MAEYYDWDKTLSYDADVTMVVGARGVGKTYGLRKQLIRDAKKGWRFIEVCRYKDELADVADGYFDKLENDPEFKGKYMFKTDSKNAYMAEYIEDGATDVQGKKIKPAWKLIGYFVALTQAQRKKKKTYFNVRRIVFDEAIIEKSDRYHRYLNDEYGVLAGLVDTASRERPDVESIKPRVYLMANACDIMNPYFIHYGVGMDLEFGYRWYDSKNFLLHYVDPGEYAIRKANDTVAGRMLRNTVNGLSAIGNEFVQESDEYVCKKPSRAKFSFGIVCMGKKYGIWIDFTEGFYYVSDKIPKNTEKPILALTSSDARMNYINANRFNKILRQFAEVYWMGIILYETPRIRENFKQVLAMFGVK